MIAVDTNILIYGHRSDTPFHEVASKRLTELAQQPAWGIPWPCIYEFLAIITHANIYKPPTPIPIAIEQIETMRSNPALKLLSESGDHWPRFRDLVLAGHVRGGAIHDAKIAAICIQHGISEFWTADRDFSRFPQLKTFNPLI